MKLSSAAAADDLVARRSAKNDLHMGQGRRVANCTETDELLLAEVDGDWHGDVDLGLKAQKEEQQDL